MQRIFHPLLSMIASATENELAKYVEYLKAENRILRARIPGQIHTRKHERETLLRYGKVIGRAIEELITIVTPSTFYRWCRQGIPEAETKNPKGGQRKPRELRELVIKIAKHTNFGYTRIIGELRKLGVKNISRQTVRNILKEEGIQPGPKRRRDTWTEFVKRHGETLWAADFFSTRTITARGLRQMYVLVFLCFQTREVVVSESTLHPNSAWVKKQTANFIERTSGRDAEPAKLLHDRDTKFDRAFRQQLSSAKIEPVKLPKKSPNLNGRCERFILTIKQELLSNFLVFGKRHLDHLITEFVDYYNNARSHSARDSLPPIRVEPDDVEAVSIDQVKIKKHVGGLVTSFERKAA